MKKFLSLIGRSAAYALLIAAFAVSVAETAQARPWHRGHDWHRGPHWHPGPPAEVYAPAPVVYAPPPASPGLNLVLPIHIR